jgi:hypothetical protein
MLVKNRNKVIHNVESPFEKQEKKRQRYMEEHKFPDCVGMNFFEDCPKPKTLMQARRIPDICLDCPQYK